MQRSSGSRHSRYVSMARRALASAITLAASATGVAPAWAQSTPAGGAEPEPGMWAFDGELNGRPGRSLQIDTQLGRGMVVSYLGYRADGSALFLQASGYRAQDDNGFTGELREFRNGPVIGGQTANGEVAGSAGTLRLAFDTPVSGTVTLPGEAPRRIARFTYGAQELSRVSGFRKDVQLTVHTRERFPGTATYALQFSGGNFQLVQTSTRDGNLCSYSGPYQLRSESIVSAEGTKLCTDAAGNQQRGTYRQGHFRFDNENFLSGSVRTEGRDEFFTGPCQAGAVLGNSPVAPCSLAWYGQPALQPGMWSFDDELDGRPGRSVQIDHLANSGMLLVSYLGYRSDGSSLFLQGAAYFGFLYNQTYTFALKEYRRGPVIGGPVTPGEEAATVGEAQLTFDSPTSGVLTLPGEMPRRISRYRYEDHTVRFDKAFEGYGYPSAHTPGTPMSIDIVARAGVFRMDTLTRDTSLACRYRGTYRLTGEGLFTEGSRSCGTLDASTTTPYSGEIAVNENGLLRARLTENGRSPVLISAGCSNGRLCTRAELQRPR